MSDDYPIEKARFPGNVVRKYLASVGLTEAQLAVACVKTAKVVGLSGKTSAIIEVDGATHAGVPIFVHTDCGARTAHVTGEEFAPADYFKNAALMFPFPAGLIVGGITTRDPEVLVAMDGDSPMFIFGVLSNGIWHFDENKTPFPTYHPVLRLKIQTKEATARTTTVPALPEVGAVTYYAIVDLADEDYPVVPEYDGSEAVRKSKLEPFVNNADDYTRMTEYLEGSYGLPNGSVIGVATFYGAGRWDSTTINDGKVWLGGVYYAWAELPPASAGEGPAGAPFKYYDETGTAHPAYARITGPSVIMGCNSLHYEYPFGAGYLSNTCSGVIFDGGYGYDHSCEMRVSPARSGAYATTSKNTVTYDGQTFTVRWHVSAVGEKSFHFRFYGAAGSVEEESEQITESMRVYVSRDGHDDVMVEARTITFSYHSSCDANDLGSSYWRLRTPCNNVGPGGCPIGGNGNVSKQSVGYADNFVYNIVSFFATTCTTGYLQEGSFAYTGGSIPQEIGGTLYTWDNSVISIVYADIVNENSGVTYSVPQAIEKVINYMKDELGLDEKIVSYLYVTVEGLYLVPFDVEGAALPEVA